MKKLFVYLNAFLMAFHSSAFAFSKEQSNRMKQLFEVTEITKRDVSLQEFLSKVSDDLPPYMREQLQVVLENNPRMMIPKVSVQKIQGANGEESLKLQFTADKTPVAMTVTSDEQNFMQVGGVKFSAEEVADGNLFSEKIQKALPVPQAKVKDYYQATNFGLLSYDQVKKLSIVEKKKYVKKMRELLVTMEARGSAVLKLKAPKEAASHRYLQILQMMVEEAEAQNTHPYNTAAIREGVITSKNYQDTTCVYAGHIATYGYKLDGSGEFACGGKKSGFYELGFEHKTSDVRCTTSNGQIGVKCNPAVFGVNKANPSLLCATHNDSNATAYCASKSNAVDALYEIDKFSSKEEFDSHVQNVASRLQKQKELCVSILASSPSKPDKSIPHLFDQKATCEALTKRISEIEALRCDLKGALLKDTTSGEYASGKATGKTFAGSTCQPKSLEGPKNPKPTTGDVPCKDGTVPKADGIGCEPGPSPKQPSPGGPPPVVPVPPGGPNPDPKTCVDSEWNNDKNISKSQCQPPDGRVVACPADTNKWRCECSPGATAHGGPAFKCYSESKKDGGGGAGGGKGGTKSSSWKMPSWLPMLVLGTLGGALLYYGLKSQLNSQYKFLTPSATATPVPSTTATPRTRGTL